MDVLQNIFSKAHYQPTFNKKKIQRLATAATAKSTLINHQITL